ncbi:MAG: hypothetical protein Q8Q09_09670 [Deltaproteobacteria bacterium]|nr:hypothetical protein [Deltaproteobacteria bacterium]
MADEIVFSELPIAVSSTGPMSIVEAIDVSGYDQLDLALGVHQVNPSSSLIISIITSMQNEVDQGWVTAATFDSVSSAGNYQKITVRNFLRYVRYSAVVTGTGGSFTLTGLARAWR